MSRSPNDQRPGRPERPGTPGATGPDRNWRWVIYVLVALLVAVIVLPQLVPGTKRNELSYGDFLNKVNSEQVKSARVNNDSGKITGQLKDSTNYTVSGPRPATQEEIDALNGKVSNLKFENSSTNFLAGLLPIILYAGLIIGFFVWMSRRAQGQMSGVMNIGRSK